MHCLKTFPILIMIKHYDWIQKPFVKKIKTVYVIGAHICENLIQIKISIDVIVWGPILYYITKQRLTRTVNINFTLHEMFCFLFFY